MSSFCDCETTMCLSRGFITEDSGTQARGACEVRQQKICGWTPITTNCHMETEWRVRRLYLSVFRLFPSSYPSVIQIKVKIACGLKKTKNIHATIFASVCDLLHYMIIIMHQEAILFFNHLINKCISLIMHRFLLWHIIKIPSNMIFFP